MVMTAYTDDGNSRLTKVLLSNNQACSHQSMETSSSRFIFSTTCKLFIAQSPIPRPPKSDGGGLEKLQSKLGSAARRFSRASSCCCSLNCCGVAKNLPTSIIPPAFRRNKPQYID